jgi:Ca-activated chloride channel homolog
MFSFARPLWFLAVVPLAGLVILEVTRGRRSGDIHFPFSVWNGDMPSFPGRGLKAVNRIAFFFSLAGALLLVGALAGPGRIEYEEIHLSRGADILFVVDQSPSMAAQDFGPENRLGAAKEFMISFLRNRKHDPIGLVSFGREAALRFPPTLDYDALEGLIDSLAVMEFGDGTAVGTALGIACAHLNAGGAREKIVLLLTDGENNAGDIQPVSAAHLASRLGITVYTIGMGSEGEIPLEYTDPRTGKRFSGLYRSGFDEEGLKAIAELTGGTYFHAVGSGILLRIGEIIDSLEAREIRTAIEPRHTPFHGQFILAGFIAVAVGFVIRKVVLREVMV